MTVPQRDRGWFKSSRSANTNACVEVNRDGPGALVRDTKGRHVGTVRFTPAQWAAFLTDVKRH